MTFISYAQNFEDVILWRVLKGCAHGFYIDVGAFAPVEGSVTYAFYQRGWRGINIEPNTHLIRAFNSSRPEDINLNVALGANPGFANLHIVEKDPGLSTINSTYAHAHRDAGYEISTQSCPLLTIDAVWEEYVGDRSVHFLKVDVEGYEEEVLQGNDWNEHRPWIVVVEAMLPYKQIATHHEWEHTLLECEYEFVYADGLNRFYLAKERSELVEGFRYPPNFFDGFRTAPLQKAHERVAELEEALHRASAHLSKKSIEARASERRLQEVGSELEATRRDLTRTTEQLTLYQSWASQLVATTSELTSQSTYYQDRVVELERELMEGVSKPTALREELAHTSAELKRIRDRADQFEKQVLSMHYSKSWRLTAPLRSAASLIRSLTDHGPQDTASLPSRFLGWLLGLRIFRPFIVIASRNPRFRQFGKRVTANSPRVRGVLLYQLRPVDGSPRAQSPHPGATSPLAGDNVPDDLPESAKTIYAQLVSRIGTTRDGGE
jgi:FkbM family methyltransferase